MSRLNWSTWKSYSWVVVVGLSAPLNGMLWVLKAGMHMQAAGHAPRLFLTFIL